VKHHSHILCTSGVYVSETPSHAEITAATDVTACAICQPNSFHEQARQHCRS